MNFFSSILVIIIQAHLLVAFPPNFFDPFHGIDNVPQVERFKKDFDDMFDRLRPPLPRVPSFPVKVDMPPLPALPYPFSLHHPPFPAPPFNLDEHIASHHPGIPLPHVFHRANIQSDQRYAPDFHDADFPFSPQHHSLPAPHFHDANFPFPPEHQPPPVPNFYSGEGYAPISSDPAYPPPRQYQPSHGPTGDERFYPGEGYAPTNPYPAYPPPHQYHPSHGPTGDERFYPGEGYAPFYPNPAYTLHQYEPSPGSNCCHTDEESTPQSPTLSEDTDDDDKPTGKTDSTVPASEGSDSTPTTAGADKRQDPPQTADQKPDQPQKDVCNWCLRSNCKPGACTKLPNFDAKADAEELKNAMARADSKEDVLFNILMNRSEEQIQLIKQAFLSFGMKSLEDHVKSDKSFKAKDLLLALLKTRAEFFADELQYAFANLKDDIVTMILAPLPPCAIDEISSTFYTRHKKRLMEVAIKATSLKFEELIEETLKASREVVGDVEKDAESLYSSGPNAWPWTRNVRVFIEIFTHRSFDHIRKVKESYNKMYTKSDFNKIVAECTGGGKVTSGLLAILRNIEDQPGYFADEVEGALQHLITTKDQMRDNSAVIRILRGRCGIDLADIRDAYPKNHDGKKLLDVIIGKDNPDYKEAYVKLLLQPHFN